MERVDYNTIRNGFYVFHSNIYKNLFLESNVKMLSFKADCPKFQNI